MAAVLGGGESAASSRARKVTWLPARLPAREEPGRLAAAEPGRLAAAAKPPCHPVAPPEPH
eukprot:8145140-Alexandrium_andersonii.AAC.1